MMNVALLGASLSPRDYVVLAVGSVRGFHCPLHHEKPKLGIDVVGFGFESD